MAVRKEAASTRIVRVPGVCGGEPSINGTRIPVRSVVIEYQRDHDVEWVRRAYPQLDVSTIEEALAFYEANRQEIDRFIAENEVENEDSW